MSIGSRIKEIRREKGLTQKQLAEKANIATITVQQYEREVRKPKLEQIFNIARALGVQMDALLGGFEGFDTGEEFDKAWKERVSQHGGDSLGLAYGLGGSVKILHSGTPSERVTKAFEKLTPEGQEVAAKRIEELTEIPKYRKA